MAGHSIRINRAPVMTLWAAVVAERLGYQPDEALTLGRVVAGLNAASKARRLGLLDERGQEKSPTNLAKPPPETVELLGRDVPVTRTEKGLRALDEGRAVRPEAVQSYLKGKFGERLQEVEEAMRTLARSRTEEDLQLTAYPLYEAFRPRVPAGEKGWGAEGLLHLDKIRSLAQSERV